MKVRKLLHTRMRVNDIERSVKFYQDALGLEASRRFTSPRGAQLVFLRTPNSAEEIELCQMPAGAEPVAVQPDLMHLAFEVENLETFAAALAKKGNRPDAGRCAGSVWFRARAEETTRWALVPL